MSKAFGSTILIQKDNLILGIARRNNPNSFGLIGGKVDPNETEEEAATRECFEECGLKIFNLKKVFSRVSSRNSITVTFICDYAGEPSAQPGEPECKWCTVQELLDGEFGEYNRELFKVLGIIS